MILIGVTDLLIYLLRKNQTNGVLTPYQDSILLSSDYQFIPGLMWSVKFLKSLEHYWRFFFFHKKKDNILRMRKNVLIFLLTHRLSNIHIAQWQCQCNWERKC